MITSVSCAERECTVTCFGHLLLWLFQALGVAQWLPQMKYFLPVVRCKMEAKSDFPDGHYTCHPNSEFVYGSTCKYGCYEGYELVGEKELICEKSGKWSHAIPKCKRKFGLTIRIHTVQGYAYFLVYFSFVHLNVL